MSLSNIEWTDYTWNPWRGCSKVSPGCLHCYAEKLVTTRLGGEWGPGKPRKLASEKILTDPLRWNKNPWVGDGDRHRARVFLGSLMDIFDNEAPISHLADALQMVQRCEELDFLLVTKRPELWRPRVVAVMEHYGLAPCNDAFCAWLEYWLDGQAPKNVWAITSTENQEMLEERVPHLIKIPAAVHGLSCEPLLGPLSLDLTKPMPIHDDRYGDQHEYYEVKRGIDWVIAGGESGPGARPCHVEWLQSIQAQCAAADVAYFCKQLGRNPMANLQNPYRLSLNDKKGAKASEWPEWIKVRREWPEVTR